MKITKKEHKAILSSLFFEEVQGQFRPKNFSIDKLAEAGSANKKIRESVTEDKKKFIDAEIEFTPDETAILSDLFKAKKEWTVIDAEFVLELKDIFEGKEIKE
jgi:hypothetical protein